MEKVIINTNYIKLGQFLKLKGIIGNGSDAKFFLENTKVLVNGEKEDRRGRKLYEDDIVTINEIEYIVSHD